MRVESGVLYEVLDSDVQSDGTFIVPDTVTSFGREAFKNCRSLAAVNNTGNLISIRIEAFSQCMNLSSITLPDELTMIGTQAFFECIGLQTITLPKKLTSIGTEAFGGCKNLTSIILPEELTSIKDLTFFGCTSLTTITLPKSVNSIGVGAFHNCKALNTITLPKGLKSIGVDAFKGCVNLKHIVINTDKEEEYENIKKLLPEELKDKVTSFSVIEQSKKIQSQCLQQLVNEPNTNFLYQELLREGNAPPPELENLPVEVMAQINSHMKSDNRYSVKAQKELDALTIPDSEEGLEKYGEDCKAIVTKYLDAANQRAYYLADKAASKQAESMLQSYGIFAKEKRENLETEEKSSDNDFSPNKSG
ncbi:leucine-rich repeat protein [Legionella sp. PATHC038]|uniref:leucine-rich repeat domain-containing protein n=1 Tax=Legionella sheltonii TaxID=2992041 RepID=UPI0022442CAC|nr:leucine-rich repeat protein [Legionella sp. PATHC038]MCW8400629.1 leucine-rich repeat protein [Legionella sp. PATHC038]